MTLIDDMAAALREIVNAKQEKAWCDRNCETFGELVDRLQSRAKQTLREYEAVKDRVVVAEVRQVNLFPMPNKALVSLTEMRFDTDCIVNGAEIKAGTVIAIQAAQEGELE